jgi:hypothetical protein
MPVNSIERGRMNLDQDLIIPSSRLLDLFIFENIGGTIVVIDNGFHKSPPGREV